jgi:hypothetical protein
MDIDIPYRNAGAVTPSDVLNIGPATRALYIGGTGNLTVLMAGGQTVLFTALPIGWYPISVTRVFSTGTTATNIVAVW